jgi:mono/diheme cytochrome c family protein
MRNSPLKVLAVATVLTCSLCSPRSDAQESQAPQDLAVRVRSIFLAKCSECHGRGLSRPRAALYLHELGPLVANREWVVPYDPEKSYLWSLLRDDDMPAKGAKAGPLNGEEKAIVRAWITAGAPIGPRSSAPAPPDPVSQEPAPPSPTAHFFGWLGRFHVVAIHFPIALLAAAALGELLAVRRLNRRPEPTVRNCVLLAAAGAVAAVVLGWLHADVGGSGAALGLMLHRWLGTTAGVWAVAIAVLSERDSRRGQRSTVFRLLLWSGTVLVGAAAHFGGLLVHGEQFFAW